MLEFKNKTVLITGGGSGIGEAMAYQYAMKGTNVILTGRRIETLEKVQKNLETAGTQLDEVLGKRTRAIERRLRSIEALPAEQSAHILPFGDVSFDEG